MSINNNNNNNTNTNNSSNSNVYSMGDDISIMDVAERRHISCLSMLAKSTH